MGVCESICYLPSPTCTYHPPLLDSRDLRVQGLKNFRDFFLGIRDIGGTAEKGVELFFLFRSIGREQVERSGVAIEQIRHEYLDLTVGISVCKNIGTLLSLGTQAKDVVYDENGG